MAGCVLDASGALALLVPSQTTSAARAFAAAPPEGLMAPTVFLVEVRSGILRLERRKALPVGSAEVELVDLEDEMEIAPAPRTAELARAMALARQETLGMYDALYLDLAITRDVALASRDGPLLAAAQRRLVEVIDLR